MNLYHWIHLEDKLRKCDSLHAYQHMLINLLETVFPLKQALFFSMVSADRIEIQHISHMVEVNHRSASLVWIENELIPSLIKKSAKPIYYPLTAIETPLDEQFLGYNGLLYIPLYSSQIGQNGILCWLDEPPDDALIKLMPLIANSIIHGLEKIAPRSQYHRWSSLLRRHKKEVGYSAVALLILSLFMPIHESAMARAEVIPTDALMITPAFNGTISKIYVKPNEKIRKGQLLFALDDLEIQAQVNDAEKKHQTALQKYLFAYHNAFKNPDYLKDLSILKSEKDLAQLEYQFQLDNLKLTQIESPDDGTIIFSDPNHLLGQPIKAGQPVMSLVQSDKIEIALWIKANEMVHLESNKAALFYSNEDPTTSYQATIESISPLATPSFANELTYFGIAKIDNPKALRLGEKGYLKVYGDRMFLGAYLTQRPIRKLRQWLGV